MTTTFELHDVVSVLTMNGYTLERTSDAVFGRTLFLVSCALHTECDHVAKSAIEFARDSGLLPENVRLDLVDPNIVSIVFLPSV